jgi:nitroreductase
MMQAIDLLLGRESALKLAEPGPSQEALDMMFASAVRAPDHGRLRPWHFVVVPAERREAFGNVLADSLLRRQPDAAPEQLQHERNKAFRAPVIVVVAAKVQHGHKIPVVEQLASASAATQSLLLAANAQGFGAVWKTGAPAYDVQVKLALGLQETDEIAGFLYIGTDIGGPSPLPRPSAASFVTVWQGQAAQPFTGPDPARH